MLCSANLAPWCENKIQNMRRSDYLTLYYKISRLNGLASVSVVGKELVFGYYGTVCALPRRPAPSIDHAVLEYASTAPRYRTCPSRLMGLLNQAGIVGNELRSHYLHSPSSFPSVLFFLFATLAMLAFRRFASFATQGYSPLTDPGSVPEIEPDVELGVVLPDTDASKDTGGHFDSSTNLYRSLCIPLRITIYSIARIGWVVPI
jgi:hypothetical protein